MNEQIKFSLERIGNLIERTDDTFSRDVKIIYEYIDGLIYCCNDIQKENQRLKKDYATIVSDNCDYLLLEKENQRLNNVLNELEKLIDEYELGKYDYSIPVFVLKEKIHELKESDK